MTLPGIRREDVKMQIDKGIPLPINDLNGPTAVLRQMDIGDSVLVEKISTREALRIAARINSIKIMTRKEGGGYRVWRVK